MKKTSTSPKSTELATLDASPLRPHMLAVKAKNTPEQLAGMILQMHLEIGATMARGLWMGCYCGKALSELKKSMGHGKWLPFVETHLEPHGVGERQVRRYMELWDEARARLLKSDNLSDLPDKPFSEFISADYQKLTGGLQKICKGETARSFAGDVLEDAGIAKKPHGSSLRGRAGGDKGGRRGKLTPEEQEAVENEAAAADRDTLTEAAAQVLREKSFLRWPATGKDRKALEALQGDLTDITGHIKTLLAAK